MIDLDNYLNALKLEIAHGNLAFLYQDGPAGNFKKVVRLADPFDHLAIAYIHTPTKTEKGGKLEYQMISTEVKALRLLAEKGYPVVDVHTDVFEIEPGRYGFVLDYVPNASMIDCKSKNQALDALKGWMTGVAIPTHQEAYYMRQDEIINKVEKSIQEYPISYFKDKAKILSESFNTLSTRLMQDSLAIIDLQLLIARDGKLKIIDPLSICQVGSEAYQDILDPQQLVSNDCIARIKKANAIINKVLKWLNRIQECETKEHLSRLMMPLICTPSNSSKGKTEQKPSLLKYLMKKKIKEQQPLEYPQTSVLKPTGNGQL